MDKSRHDREKSERETKKSRDTFDYDNYTKNSVHYTSPDGRSLIGSLMHMCWIVGIISLVLALMATALDVHPTWKKICRVVDKQYEIADGTLSSSTCKYYRGELDPVDMRKWEASAKAETDAKCMEAEITRSQTPIVMKMRLLTYEYVPWESGKFWIMLKDGFVYAIGGVIPIVFAITRFLTYTGYIGPAYPVSSAPHNFC